MPIVDDFLKLSALLTGVDDLDREVGADYLKILQEYYWSSLEKLLAVYRQAAATGDPLKSLTAHFKSGPDDDAGTPDKRPVSGGHFQHGLLWRVIKAHPPAFSYQRHGYWAKKPA